MGYHADFPDVRTGHRGLRGPFLCYFETNSTSAPDGLVDDSGIVRTYARTAAGRFLITLNDVWRAVYATSHLEEADTNVARVSARSAAGSGSGSTIQVSVLDLNNAEADTTDKTVAIQIWVQD